MIDHTMLAMLVTAMNVLQPYESSALREAEFKLRIIQLLTSSPIEGRRPAKTGYRYFVSILAIFSRASRIPIPLSLPAPSSSTTSRTARLTRTDTGFVPEVRGRRVSFCPGLAPLLILVLHIIYLFLCRRSAYSETRLSLFCCVKVRKDDIHHLLAFNYRHVAASHSRATPPDYPIHFSLRQSS